MKQSEKYTSGKVSGVTKFFGIGSVVLFVLFVAAILPKSWVDQPMWRVALDSLFSLNGGSMPTLPLLLPIFIMCFIGSFAQDKGADLHILPREGEKVYKVILKDIAIFVLQVVLVICGYVIYFQAALL